MQNGIKNINLKVFVERINILLEGANQRDVANVIGISQPSISRYKEGKRLPDIETLYKLSQFSGKSIEWILGIDGDAPKKVSPAPRAKVAQPGIPILSRCPAGRPQAWFALDSVADAPQITDILRHGEYDFALSVQGDSMFPFIYHDDVVVVSPEIEPSTGDVVVARIGEEVTVKRVRLGKTVNLIPENAKYPTIEISRAEVDLLGCVTAVVRRARRNGRQVYDYSTVELLRDASIARLAAELEKLPEEFREALRAAVAQGGTAPKDHVRLVNWCQRILRRAQDEVDKLFGV